MRMVESPAATEDDYTGATVYMVVCNLYVMHPSPTMHFVCIHDAHVSRMHDAPIMLNKK